MRLTELNPTFIRYEERVESWDAVEGDPATWVERGKPTVSKTGPREYRIMVSEIAEAQGIQLLCPLCFKANGNNAAGTHFVEVTFKDRGVPDQLGCHNKAGQPTRWTATGSDFNDLSTSPSIMIEDACGWHGFITNGEVT